jgi:hypothetical protein
MLYNAGDFEAVPGVPNVFYCPGCNASPDDHSMPSGPHCPCGPYGSGNGSLTAAQVREYLLAQGS